MIKLGVTGFIINRQKVLLLKRSSKEKLLPGFFEMPGGKIKFKETAEYALIREIKEETNLTAQVLAPYNIFSYFSNNKTSQTFDLQFICRVKKITKLKLSREHESYVWANLKELKKLKTSPETRQAILRGFKTIKI